MKLQIVDNRLLLVGKMVIGSHTVDASFTFDDIQEALDFASVNNLDLSNDPIALGYSIGSLAVQVSADNLNHALIQQGLVFSTDDCWKDSLLKLAEVITSAANEML